MFISHVSINLILILLMGMNVDRNTHLRGIVIKDIFNFFLDHAVSQPISMGTGRRVGVGTGYHHQTSEVGTVLSPRSRLVYHLIIKISDIVTCFINIYLNIKTWWWFVITVKRVVWGLKWSNMFLDQVLRHPKIWSPEWFP